MLNADQLRQRYLARQRRLEREAAERTADAAGKQQASSPDAVAEAIARALARRQAQSKPPP